MRASTPSLIFLGLALVSLLQGCASGVGGDGVAAPMPSPRPTRCQQVDGGDLARVLAEAREGDSLCLTPGRWRGSVTVSRRVSLWGPRDAVIFGPEPGSVVTLAASGSTLAGVSIDGSGGRFDKLDAAVHVVADDVRVEGVQVIHSVYGILVEKVRRATIVRNHVVGDAATAMGMRGDTIRLWETYDSLVADNLVEDGRDMVVWYSSRNTLRDNRVLRGRYGVHFMYSHDNEVLDNAFVDGVVGMFVMYSRRVRLERNLVLNAAGASGMGIGLKDSGDIVVEDNVLVHDNVGIYIDETPGHVDESLALRGNVIRQCTTGLQFHTTPQRTIIEGNDLADNMRQVAAAAGTHSEQATWRGNYFDDYAGYDLDDDGVGDLPHRAESTSEDLVAQLPELAFLRGAPALALVDIGARLLPLWTPRTIFVDERPRMNPRPLPALRTTAPSSGTTAPEVEHED